MAPRAIWKGSITFGLISIPVKVFTAVGRESSEKIDLHLLHEKDDERIRYERTCGKGHKDISWDEIVKGYEYEKGKWVEITDEDLEALELESLRTIDVVSFAPLEQIDPLYFNKAYYVVPDAPAIKAYKLMVEALEDEDLVGVCKVAMRDREHLSALRIKDSMMVLETMHWPEELRAAEFDELSKRPSITDRERKMARQLVQQLTEDFDPSQFKDEYHQALKKVIDKKIAGEEIVVQEEEADTGGEVLDIMEALKASVDAAKKGKKPSAKTASRSKSLTKDGDSDLDSLSKQELEERARNLDIPGRSKMGKKDLIKAIRKSA
jgi:DNA end-binding protein Ku